ncbi:MAG: hypothetical protein QM723_18425 [Myxococcaceae bacterium]
MEPQREVHVDGQLAESNILHEGIPLIFGFAWLILVSPFWLLGLKGTALNAIGLVGALVAAIITVVLVVRDIRHSYLDPRVARHLYVTTWLPYVCGVACAYYGRRFDEPWLRDRVLAHGDVTAQQAIDGFWSMWPSIGSHSLGLAVTMGISGALVRWAQNGDLRARIVGQWVGIGVGVLGSISLADHAYVDRVLDEGGVHFTLRQERIDSALDCIRAKGKLLREKTECTSDGRSQDCETEEVEVACSVPDATRDLNAIHDQRLREAALSDPRFLMDSASLTDLTSDCIFQGIRPGIVRPPLPSGLCSHVQESIASDGGTQVIALHVACMADCASTAAESVECGRSCTQRILPWLPDWAFTYESHSFAEDAGSN